MTKVRKSRGSNPRSYPNKMTSSETGRPLKRGLKRMTIKEEGYVLTYDQPGWWASLADPNDLDGQLVDEDNEVRSAARREAKARAKLKSGERHVLTPLVIKAIREKCSLTQRQAAELFGGGPKAFEKYESGEILPSSSMVRLLLLAAARPKFFRNKDSGFHLILHSDSKIIRDAVRTSSVDGLWKWIYGPKTARKPRGTGESRQKKGVDA